MCVPSFASDQSPCIAAMMLSLRSVCALCSQGTWVSVRTPRKSSFMLGKGELVAFPVSGNRAALYSEHGYVGPVVTLPTPVIKPSALNASLQSSNMTESM